MKGLANRLAMMSGWRNPYITDGLVAMWDAEWNVGGGKHDSSYNAITDLIGSGCNLQLSGHDFKLFDNHVFVKLYNSEGITVETPHLSDITTGTLELVYKKYNYNSQDLEIGVNNIRHDIYNRVHYVWSPSVKYGASANTDLSSYSISAFDNVANNAVYDNGEKKICTSTESTFSTTFSGFKATWNYNEIWFYTMRYYSRVLGEDEVRANYAVDKARFNLT